MKYLTDDETAPCVIKRLCRNTPGAVMDPPTALNQTVTDVETHEYKRLQVDLQCM